MKITKFDTFLLGLTVMMLAVRMGYKRTVNKMFNKIDWFSDFKI